MENLNRSRWCFTATLFCCLAPAAPLQAQEPQIMEEVIVEAERETQTEAELKDRTAFVTVIEAKDYEERLTTVPDLLEQSVGVNVRRFGGLGAFTTVSIRGSSAEQVAILLDGVPLNRGRSGIVNLSNIPLRNVERIEVYRGVAPLRFRSTAIGGVVNIVTKQAKGEVTHQASGSYGSFNTYDLNALSSGQIDKKGYLLSGTYAHSDGDFEFIDDNGTRFNKADDEKTKRRNNNFDSWDVLGKFSYDFSPTRQLQISNDYFNKDEGVPGISSNQSESANLDTIRNLFSVKAREQALFVPELEGEMNLYAVYEETQFKDLEGEIGTGRQDNQNENLGWGADSYFRYYWGDHQIPSLLLSFQNERFDSKDKFAVQQGDVQKRNIYQFGVEDEIYLWGDRLVLSPQALYTYLDNDFGGNVTSSPKAVDSPGNEDHLSYKIGGKFRVIEGLFLKANAGRYFRYPNFSELFGDRGTIVGNPELKSERGDNWDVGFAFSKQDFKLGHIPINQVFLEAVYFNSSVDDLILFEQTSQRTVRPINISSADISGVETSWAFTLFDHLNINGNFTYQDAKNTSNIPFLKNNKLPGRPEKELYNRVEFFQRWIKLYYEFNYLADNFLDQANFEKVDSRKIHNVGISVYPFKDVTLNFEVKNLTDEQVSDVLGFPLPGIAYVGTVLVKF